MRVTFYQGPCAVYQAKRGRERMRTVSINDYGIQEVMQYGNQNITQDRTTVSVRC
jgi:hypothetical protein